MSCVPSYGALSEGRWCAWIGLQAPIMLRPMAFTMKNHDVGAVRGAAATACLIAALAVTACARMSADAPASQCPEPVAARPAAAKTSHQTVLVAKPDPVTIDRALASYDPSVAGQDMLEVTVADVLATPDGGAVVLLDPTATEDERLVPVTIGPSEGMAVALRMRGEELPRPLTHDLLDSVMAEQDLRVGRVEIDDLQDGTFLGRLVLVDEKGMVHQFDARPSDCIALALGAGAPIYVARHVYEDTSVLTDELGTELPVPPPRPER